LFYYNTRTEEGHWGGDEALTYYTPGDVYHVFCWSSHRVVQDDFDDVELEFRMDGACPA